MNFLKEKAIELDNQLKTWHDIVKRPYKRECPDNYTRCRQIFLNGIEIEAWGFKHSFARICDNVELKNKLITLTRIEDAQQSSINWLIPHNQTPLDTTLGYEQVAVDLTSWLAQNEDDSYVKEVFDFGLLEDFDHLYRYSQFAKLLEDTDPDEILHGNTDVVLARPTQYHHNCNVLRTRKPYDKNTVTPKTRVNILSLLSAEQQTHNFYSHFGGFYANYDLKTLYAEICDVEEEHTTMYESLIDPKETLLEKWLVHEFCECCCYYNCYLDEKDTRIKQIYEEMFKMELAHLHIAADAYQTIEKKDPESIIGNKEVMPCTFKSQKEYVQKVIKKEANKRLDKEGTFNTVDKLPDDWRSYTIQTIQNEKGAPSEQAVRLSLATIKKDVAKGDLIRYQSEILKSSLEKIQANNTVSPDEYREIHK